VAQYSTNGTQIAHLLTHAGPSVQNKYSAVSWFGLEAEDGDGD